MKYKVIKSAAHNFGHSFVSSMNYHGDDYVMSHLARLVVETGRCELSVDLKTGRAEPRALLWGPVGASVRAHVRRFPRLLASQDIELAMVRAASMRVLFRPDERSVRPGLGGAWEIPFECVVTVEDDRRKLHEGRVRDSWLVDDSIAPPRWLRTVYWWRSELRRRWILAKHRILPRADGKRFEPPSDAPAGPR